MRELYADLPADQFSPKKLKVVRQAFIERDNSRTHVNTCTRRVVAIFRWAAEDEMVPGSVPHALQSVRPLEQGRGNVREGNAVEAVDQETVDATLAELTPIVADMVRLQLASGAPTWRNLQSGVFYLALLRPPLLLGLHCFGNRRNS